MVTDKLIDLITFINDFLCSFTLLTDISSAFIDFVVDLLPDWIGQMQTFLSYVYFFIPFSYLNGIIVLVFIIIFVRIGTAILNLLWP